MSDITTAGTTTAGTTTADTTATTPAGAPFGWPASPASPSTPARRGGPPSIGQRLSAALWGVAAVGGLAVSLAVGLAVHREVDELMDNGLQEAAEILYGLLSFNAAALPQLPTGGSLPAPAHTERLVWQVVSPDGQVLLRSHQAPAAPLMGAALRGPADAGEDWRVYGLPFPLPASSPADGAGRSLLVAQPRALRRQAHVEAGLATAGAALLVGGLCALWLRRRVRAELQPIDALSTAVAAYDPLAAAQVLPAPARLELLPLHQAIQDLGERLADRVASERAFSAHAAHALRTPLAGMVAQLAVAQRKAPAALQPRLQRARDAADRLRRVVTALLSLFRTGADVQRRPVDLPALLAHLPVEPLQLHCDVHQALWADADLLAAALANLLDNAARHGARSLTLRLRRDARGHWLELHDDGRGLAGAQALQMQALLDARRYERPVGLGLMLADLVARAHGSRLQLLPVAAGFGVALGLGQAPEDPQRPPDAAD